MAATELTLKLDTNVGFSEKMSLILTGVWGCVGTLSAVYAAFCFDLLGRRPTMVRTSDFPCLIRLTTVPVYLVDFDYSRQPRDLYNVGRLRKRRQCQSVAR